MFEAVELGRKVASADYKAQVPALRGELLDVQTRLREVRRSSVIILFGGVDGAGKSESVNLLNEWMDPRWLLTRAYGPTFRRRARASRVLAVLARPAAEGPHRLFSERLVLASARRPRPPAAEPRRVRRAARRDHRLRARPHQRRRAHPEVLDAPRQGVAEGAAEEAGEGSAHPLAGDARAVGQLEAVRALHRCGGRDHHPHEPRERALDDRGWRRRALSKPDDRHRHSRCDPQAAGRVGGAAACVGTRRRKARTPARPQRRIRPARASRRS